MSSASKISAINDLQRMAQTFRGILSLAEELKDFVSLEAEREKISKQIDDARLNLATIADDTNRARAELDRLLKDVDGSTRAIELDRVHAADITAAARVQAQDIVAKAHSESEAVKCEAQEYVDDLKSKRDSLETTISEMEDYDRQLKAEHKQLVAAHGSLQEEYRRLHDGLKALLP